MQFTRKSETGGADSHHFQIYVDFPLTQCTNFVQNQGCHERKKFKFFSSIFKSFKKKYKNLNYFSCFRRLQAGKI